MFSTLGGQISSVMCVTSIFFNVFYPGRTNFLSYVCYQHFLQCFLPWVTSIFFNVFYPGRKFPQLSHTLPDNKILDWSKLIQIADAILTVYDNFLDWSKSKSFADDKLNFAEKLKFVLEKVESILEKMLVTSINIFSFSQNVFKRPLSQGSLKVVTVWERVRAHFE